MDSESPKDGQSEPAQPADRVELKTFSDSNSADLAKASLEARGIECWLKADDCGGMYPNLAAAGGLRLLVRASDADAAVALLDTQASPAEISQIETEAIASPPQESTPIKKLSPGQILLGVAAGTILCLLYQWTDKFGTKTYRYDSNHDGRTDEILVYRNGRRVEMSYDRNFDGKFDYWIHYDSAGKRILTKADNNFDGVPDVTWRYTNGVLASGEFDTDYNGIPDVTYTYADDLVKQGDWRPNGTNIVTLRQFFRYGVLTEEARDIDRDGTFDVTIYYNAFQTPIATNTVKFVLPTSPP